MLVFSNCKINLGLNVINKRLDGFHNLKTVFYPINWLDALEVIEDDRSKNGFSFSQSGLTIDVPIENNLIYKAWQLITNKTKLPPIKVNLVKRIPMGAGLGGGSSNAAYFITLINSKFDLGFSSDDMIQLSSQIGSDCAFFINNKPVFAEGKGDVLSSININLNQYYILLVFPNIYCNTKDAFNNLIYKTPTIELKTIIEKMPIGEWKNNLINDFEQSIFLKHPKIKELKELFYSEGAVYSSMSGSGSCVFGIFDQEPNLKSFEHYQSFLQKPNNPLF